MAQSSQPPIIDEQRASLIHELILSNRVVENLMKGVNEIHGEKAAEQVMLNVLRKDGRDGQVMDSSIAQRSETTDSMFMQEESRDDWKSNVEKLAERTPRLLNKFVQKYTSSLAGQPDSVPRNRRDEPLRNSASVEEATEQIQQVCDQLEPIIQKIQAS